MANIATLEDVKTYLRYPNPSDTSSDDAAIQWFMNAADEVIKFECGDILPQVYDEMHDGGEFSITTWRKPILRVMNVEEGWGWIDYELDFQEVNANPKVTGMFGYSIDNYETGIISRRSFGNVNIPFMWGTKNIHVVYEAGETNVPGNVFLADLELIAHWWQNSQLRAVALAGTNVAYDAVEGALYSRDTESGVQNINIGVPYRILEMIKGHRHDPFFA